MCVELRCTIVTSTSFSHRAPQMSKAELLLPITTTFFPRRRPGRGGPRSGAGRPSKTSMPGTAGMLALPDMPVAKTSCVGRSVSGLPSRSTSTVHSPVSSE